MDRREIKTRAAIFAAFIDLLSRKRFEQITVGEIIEGANIGRATFYAHFETKQFLLKALCEELFCHIMDAVEHNPHMHKHIFSCNPPESAFVHLFHHIKQNDNHILDLLSSTNNDLFLYYFQENLESLVARQLPCFQHRKMDILPESYWNEHICAVFTHTVKWWIANGMQQSPEQITQYFLAAV